MEISECSNEMIYNLLMFIDDGAFVHVELWAHRCEVSRRLPAIPMRYRVRRRAEWMAQGLQEKRDRM